MLLRATNAIFCRSNFVSRCRLLALLQGQRILTYPRGMHPILNNMNIQLEEVHISLPLIPIKVGLSKTSLFEYRLFKECTADAPE